MPKTRIVTAFDIGTSAVKAVVVVKEDNSFKTLFQSSEPCLGVRRGVVIEPGEVSGRIGTLLKKIQEKTSHKVNAAFVNISGSHLSVIPAHGEVAVSRADQKISREDVDRVLQAAQTFPLPPNKEIISVFPLSFIVDGERGIKEALGMQGVKLEADILALSVFSPYYKNLTSAVLGAGLHIDDLVPSALASSRAVLSLKEKELGVAVLDIGAGTSDLAVFEERDLIHLAVVPIGSGHITNDIALGLKIDVDIAEKIKKEFGSCLSAEARKAKAGLSAKKQKQKIDLSDGEESLVFSPKTVAGIIEARTADIFEQVEKELKKISRQGLLPSGVVLVGGGSKLPGMVEFAKAKLKLPVRLGRVKEDISGFQSDLAFTAACGLAYLGFDSEEDSPSLGKGVFSRIKRIFRVFIP